MSKIPYPSWLLSGTHKKNLMVERIRELEAENKRISSNAGEMLAEADMKFNKEFNRRVELESQLSACEPYLKEGETPAQCIARNRQDAYTAGKMYAKERAENERLKKQVELLQIVEKLGEDTDGYWKRQKEDAERWRWEHTHRVMVETAPGVWELMDDAAIDAARGKGDE